MINRFSMNCYKCSRIVLVCVSVFVSKTKFDDNISDYQIVVCLFSSVFNIWGLKCNLRLLICYGW